MGILERKEREREARRTAILDAAEAVFKSKGFASATMDDIARTAELAKGTVYLYYKSKEELQVGLMIRGTDIMLEVFHSVLAEEATNFDKLRKLGDAYWQFAHDYAFYFGLQMSDHLPANSGQISQEMVISLHERSNEVWSMIVDLIEGSKREGMVRPEVDAFSVSVLLWLNSMGVLRMNHKIRAVPENVYANSAHFNPCNIDFRAMYTLNGTIMLHEIVTEQGAAALGPVIWPQHTTFHNPAINCTPNGNLAIGTFAEDAVTAQSFGSGL